MTRLSGAAEGNRELGNSLDQPSHIDYCNAGINRPSFDRYEVNFCIFHNF